MIFKKTGFVRVLTLGVLGLLVGCSSYVSSVKDGILLEYSKNITIGQALDSWAKTHECSNAQWESIETIQGAKVVQFTCAIDINSLRTKEDMASNITEKELTKATTAFNDKLLIQMRNADVVAALADADAADAAADTFANTAWRDAFTMRATARATRADASTRAINAVDAAIRLKKDAIEKHIVKKCLKEIKVLSQFNISADGKTFANGFQGFQLTFEDGKKSNHEFYWLLKHAYNNKKIDSNNIIDFSDYKNRK